MSEFVGSTWDVTETGSVWVDGLLWGSRWLTEKDNHTLTYSFLENEDTYDWDAQ